jgi:hypothetical protein
MSFLKLLAVMTLGAIVALGCKPREEVPESGTLATEGSVNATKLDAIDVSFFMPQVTPQAKQAGMAISVKEAGGCASGVPANQCGPILSAAYFKQIVEKVPRYKETKDMFTDFRGNPVGRSVEQAYNNLFISAFRYDPCAPAAHKAKDGPGNFSKDNQCEAELRFVVQHWDENGKPADQGLHIGVNLTKEESHALLAELIALKQFAASKGINTNGVPIGIHPAMDPSKASAAVAKKFFNKVKKISKDFSGTAITKGVATFITLARKDGGVRWQWALTAQPQKKQVGSDPEKFVFGPQVVSVGAPNIQGAGLGKFGPSVGIEVFRDKDNNRVSEVVPSSLTADPLSDLANTILFTKGGNKSPTDQIKDLDGKPLTAFNAKTGKQQPITINSLIGFSLAVENPRITFLKPRPNDPDLGGFIGECSACHIQTPGRLRLYQALGINSQAEAALEAKVPTKYKAPSGITATMLNIVREEYQSSNPNSLEGNYVFLNMGWHDSFANKRNHPSINMRTINETAEVVHYINNKMMKEAKPGGESEEAGSMTVVNCKAPANNQQIRGAKFEFNDGKVMQVTASVPDARFSSGVREVVYKTLLTKKPAIGGSSVSLDFGGGKLLVKGPKNNLRGSVKLQLPKQGTTEVSAPSDLSGTDRVSNGFVCQR